MKTNNEIRSQLVERLRTVLQIRELDLITDHDMYMMSGYIDTDKGYRMFVEMNMALYPSRWKRITYVYKFIKFLWKL